MLHAGQHPHLGEEALEQNLPLVRRCLQHLEGHRAAHQNVLAAIDDSHAARADAIENPVIAEHQVSHAAGENASRLIIGDQPRLRQARQEVVGVLGREDFLLGGFLERMPFLHENDTVLDHFLEQQARGAARLGCVQCVAASLNHPGAVHDLFADPLAQRQRRDRARRSQGRYRSSHLPAPHRTSAPLASNVFEVKGFCRNGAATSASVAARSANCRYTPT